jgi:hypothetical protein
LGGMQMNIWGDIFISSHRHLRTASVLIGKCEAFTLRRENYIYAI